MSLVRWPREAWLPIVAGLAWLWTGVGHGVFGGLLVLLPGSLLLASGVSMLLMTGDARISQFTALGGLLGVLLALPGLFAFGFVPGISLLAASAISFAAAGYHAARLEPETEGVPAPTLTPSLAAQVAIDEALLSTMTVTLPLPTADDHNRIAREIAAARELFESKGWLEKPVDYHPEPPALDAPTLRWSRTRGIDYEHLSFASDYEPHPDEPGRERWLGYAANRTAHAWVMRHQGAQRPWLVCIHGYQMGVPLIDLSAFDPSWLHDRLGLNLLFPVLPLHGPRKIGRRSGDGFLAGEILDSTHAEAQAMWDIRRMLSWVREQGQPDVGAMGYSLGGYNTALLACLDDDLKCAIPGIPASDFTRLLFRHGPPLQLRDIDRIGTQPEHMREVLSVVSPLHLTPKVPHERRYLFGGTADRLVPPDQVRDLWRHWDEPRIEWYHGAHVTFGAHRGVASMVQEALRESGLAR